MGQTKRGIEMVLLALVFLLCGIMTAEAQSDPILDYQPGIGCVSWDDARNLDTAKERGLRQLDVYHEFRDSGRCYPAVWKLVDFSTHTTCKGITVVSGYTFPGEKYALEMARTFRRKFRDGTLPTPKTLYIPATVSYRDQKFEDCGNKGE